MKPKVVIFSAQEDEKVAGAIQENIAECTEVIVWTQGIFPPAEITLQALDISARRHDFAIFVLTPVDRLTMRVKEYLVPRDNVVFESGLFLGRLGRERTFFVAASARNLNLSAPFRIFTDLHGLTRAKYDPSQTNLVAALAPACNQIKREIERLGVLRHDVHIINKKSGKCLDVAGWSKADGTPIIQFNFHGSDNQLWSLLRIDQRRFKIMSRNSGKFMDVVGPTTKGGAYVHQWPGNNGASQEWQIEPSSGGGFKIMCTHSEKYLTVEAGSSDNGARVIQQGWYDDDSFRWWVNSTLEIS